MVCDWSLPVAPSITEVTTEVNHTYGENRAFTELSVLCAGTTLDSYLVHLVYLHSRT